MRYCSWGRVGMLIFFLKHVLGVLLRLGVSQTLMVRGIAQQWARAGKAGQGVEVGRAPSCE